MTGATADFLSKFLTGTILIGYPLMFLVLFASPFWLLKHGLKQKMTPIVGILCVLAGVALGYGWFKLGVWALSYLQGLAACELYGC